MRAPTRTCLRESSKINGDQFADGAGLMHFTHVAKALAFRGLGDFVTSQLLKYWLGGFVVEDFAFFVDDLGGGNAPDFVF